MDDITRNPDGSYMDADQIYSDIITNRVPDEQTQRVIANNFDLVKLATPQQKAMCEQTGLNPYGLFYQQLGRWIRNSYGLLREDNPYTKLREAGTDDIRHPDNYSAAIVDRLVKHYAAELNVKG